MSSNMSLCSSNTSKWNVAIKVINDDVGIEQIEMGTDMHFKSSNFLDNLILGGYGRSQFTPLTQNRSNINTPVSLSPNDGVSKPVSVAEKSLERPKRSPVTGVKWQRRKKRGLRKNRRTSVHKQNKHCNGETSSEISTDSPMFLEDKVVSPKEGTDVNKSLDIQETDPELQFVNSSSAQLDKLVVSTQPAKMVYADAEISDRPYVWIQEITESPSILEILNLFPYNSGNTNSCEASQNMELSYKRRSTQDNSNLIDTSPLEFSSPKVATARSPSKADSLISANNGVPQAPLNIPNIGTSLGKTHLSTGFIQQQPLKQTSPLSLDIEPPSKSKSPQQQEVSKGTSPLSTNGDQKSKSLPEQKLSKGTPPLSLDAELCSKSKSPQHQQPPETPPSPTDREPPPKSTPSNDNVIPFPIVDVGALNSEDISVNDFSSTDSSPTWTLNSFVNKKLKPVPHNLKKTRSYLGRKTTPETDSNSAMIVQKSRGITKRSSDNDLTKKQRSRRKQKSRVPTEKSPPDQNESNAIPTEKSVLTLTERPTLDLKQKSSPLLVRRFCQARKYTISLRKTHRPRSDVLPNNQSNINNGTTEQDMNGNVGISSGNHSDETDQEQFEASRLAADSPVFNLTTAQSEQNPESSGTNTKKFNENSVSTKRNAVIMPPSEHISFTQCGDVKFTKPIFKSISKLAKNNSRPVYVILDKSPRASHSKNNQLIFRLDSSTLPYKLVKTTSSFDELTTKDKTLLQLSSKKSPKRKGLSKTSLKRQSTTPLLHLLEEGNDPAMLMEDRQFVQFSPKKSPKRPESSRNALKKRQSTPPHHLPNDQSSGSELMTKDESLIHISPKKSPKRPESSRNTPKKRQSTTPHHLPNDESSGSELMTKDESLIHISPKKSPKRPESSRNTPKKRQSTPPPNHLPNDESSGSELMTKDESLIHISPKKSPKRPESSRNTPKKRQSTTPHHLLNDESSGSELMTKDESLIHISPKKSPKRKESSRNTPKKRQSTTPHHLLNDESSGSELMTKDESLIHISPKKSPKRKESSRNTPKKRQSTTPNHLPNDESSDSELMTKDESLIHISPKKSPKRPESSRNTPKKRQSTPPPNHLPNDESSSSQLMTKDVSLIHISSSKSPKRNRRKRHSTTPPVHLPNELSHAELLIEDKPLVHFLPEKSPKRQEYSRNSPKRQSTIPSPSLNDEPSYPDLIVKDKPPILLRLSTKKSPKRQRSPRISSKRQSSTPPSSHSHTNESSDSEVTLKDKPLLLRISSLKSPKNHEMSTKRLKRQSTTTPVNLLNKLNDSALLMDDTPLEQLSNKKSPKKHDLFKDTLMRQSTTTPVNLLNKLNDSALLMDETPLEQLSNKKSPKKHDLFKDTLMRQSTTPVNLLNKLNDSALLMDETPLVQLSTKTSSKKHDLFKDTLKRQSTTPVNLLNKLNDSALLMDETPLVQLSTKTSPKKHDLFKDSLKRQSTTPPHSSDDTPSDLDHVTKDKPLLKFSSKKSPKRPGPSRKSQKRHSTTPPHLSSNEASYPELIFAEPDPKDVALRIDTPVMPNGVGIDAPVMPNGALTSSNHVRQWTCEDVSLWLASLGLTRFIKDFTDVNGQGLVELVQYFIKDMKILQKYLRDMCFSFSERMKLYAALRALHKRTLVLASTSPTGNSDLSDHGKAAPIQQKNISSPALTSPHVAENGQQISSSPISQWTCEDVCRLLTSHNLSKFTKDFSNVDGNLLVELLTCRSPNSSIHSVLYSMGFTISEFLNLSVVLSELSQQLTLE